MGHASRIGVAGELGDQVTTDFARCDDPTTAVRWTDLAVVTDSGREVPIDRVRTGYQTHQAGGCDNTNSVIDGLGALQLTNTDRHTPAGTVLILPARS